MITNNNSWSLGATPNKSLDSSPQPVGVGANIEPSIPIHLQGDLIGNPADQQRKKWVLPRFPHLIGRSSSSRSSYYDPPQRTIAVFY